MAASAANTSRGAGAVIGVAVLGMLVNSELNSHLIASLRRLGIPANFQAIVVNAVETGTVPSSRNAKGVGAAGEGKLVLDVIHAAYSAFYAGLRAALFLSAALVLAAGLFTIAMFGHHNTPGIGRRPAASHGENVRHAHSRQGLSLVHWRAHQRIRPRLSQLGHQSAHARVVSPPARRNCGKVTGLDTAAFAGYQFQPLRISVILLAAALRRRCPRY